MSNDIVGWVITNYHVGGDYRRIGYGQILGNAIDTRISYNAIVGRTIYVKTDLKNTDIPYDQRVRWRSYDDDGEACYEGYVRYDWLMGDVNKNDEEEELAYNIDLFNMEDVGAVTVLYNGDDMTRCAPEQDKEKIEAFVERSPRMAMLRNTNWIPIYS